MSGVTDRAALTDRLVSRLIAGGPAHPVAGDFAAVCTDRAADTWTLFPIALTMSDGTVLQLRDQAGGLLAFSSIAERDEALVTAAADFPDVEAARGLCWMPFDGLGPLRVRLARLKRAAP